MVNPGLRQVERCGELPREVAGTPFPGQAVGYPLGRRYPQQLS